MTSVVPISIDGDIIESGKLRNVETKSSVTSIAEGVGYLKSVAEKRLFKNYKFFDKEMWTLSAMKDRIATGKLYKTFIDVQKVKMSDVDEIISTLALV